MSPSLLPTHVAHTTVKILVLLGALYMVIPHYLEVHISGPSKERAEHLTVLGHLLSESFFNSRALFEVNKLLFCIAGICWILRVCVPLSGILATASFFFYSSIWIENSYYTKHEMHPIMAGLLSLSAWYCWHGKSSDTATRLAPGWWRDILIGWFAITYTWSGWTKVFASGGNWLSGDLLRVWLVRSEQSIYCGAPCQAISQFLVHSPILATIAQVGVLFIECSALVILRPGVTRIVFGGVLVLFHLTSNLVFGFHFWAAAILCFYLLIKLECTVTA
jgi:hypothetical protein